jgi:hypothetical protein
MHARDKVALMIEYGWADELAGESDIWYYEHTIQLIRAHLKKFPNRKIIFRFRPHFLKYNLHFSKRRRFLLDLLQNKKFFVSAKHLILKGYIPKSDLGGGLYLKQQDQLLEYMNKELPRGSFEIDTNQLFRETLQKASYVIGNFSTCFLEAMYRRIPYYCYNPGLLNYPPPLEMSKPYVFNKLGDLMNAIDKVSFEEFFEKYTPYQDAKTLLRNYESARSLFIR